MNDSPTSRPRVVRFGVFELDRQSRELRKAGVRLNLPEQPLQLLECLLDHPGELVDRDELCRRLWPGDTFVDFEHGLNAAVKRLRDVLGDSADSPRFVETVPRRGYRFLAPVEHRPNGAVEQHEPAVAAQRSRRLVWWGSAIVLAALASGAVAWKVVPSRADVASDRNPRLVQLSTLSGWSDSPTFSPDGSQVAFSRVVEGIWKSGVYVQLVGSSESRQLMAGAADDYGPSWSPDGRRIAFLRRGAGGSRIHLTSPLGGSAVKVSDFAADAPISWSPDGRYLAAQRHTASTSEESAIWLIPVDGGNPRAITHATPPAVNSSPSFSPDGRRLAYASCTDLSEGGCHIEVISLTSDFTRSPTPVSRIPGTLFQVRAIAWTLDGQSLIFDGQIGGSGLLRAPANGSKPPSTVDVAGLNASVPATARMRGMLAFVRWTYNVDVYRFDPDKPAGGVATSTLDDYSPDFSPDGKRIAFVSDRAGSGEIWVAAADGSGAHPLTHGPTHGSPHWAPDGRSIAFDSLSPDDRQWHVWTVDSDGGAPRQITHGPGHQNIPSWSHDGRWIYFSADRGRGRNIWRVNAHDGTEQQITRTGAGSFALESADGSSLLYQPRDTDSRLLALPLGGGAVTQVAECVSKWKFAANPGGIYYVACDAGGNPRVRFLDAHTGLDRVLGRLEKCASSFTGLAVSPDGTAILYSRQSSFGADLMMVENFK
jgi:Tol biopolymer transport system component/DNA-binding winged helix-turn-helix (wHTH) protein